MSNRKIINDSKLKKIGNINIVVGFKNLIKNRLKKFNVQYIYNNLFNRQICYIHYI